MTMEVGTLNWLVSVMVSTAPAATRIRGGCQAVVDCCRRQFIAVQVAPLVLVPSAGVPQK